jgi:ribosomal protein S18 acetylase RimI-like enzyme
MNTPCIDDHSGRYQVECFHSIKDVPERFTPLFEQASQDSLFYSRHWFYLLEHSIFHSAVRVFTVSLNDASPLLILPCYESKQGTELHALSNYYSALYKPLCHSSYPHMVAVVDALIREINRHHYQRICLQPMPKDRAYEQLEQRFAHHAYTTKPFFCFGNWYEPIETSVFTDYLSHRPSQLRNTLRRKEKKLTDYHIIISSDLKEIEILFPHYQTVYAKSWKGDEAYPDFIEEMVFSLAQRGAMRVAIAYIANEPAAAQLWMISQSSDTKCGQRNNIASIYKLAYDPRFKNSSIGSILTEAMFKHVIEQDRVSKIDYLSGDDAYKKDWMSHRNERWGLLMYNKRTFKGFFLGVVALIFGTIKKKLKALKGAFFTLKERV